MVLIWPWRWNFAFDISRNISVQMGIYYRMKTWLMLSMVFCYICTYFYYVHQKPPIVTFSVLTAGSRSQKPMLFTDITGVKNLLQVTFAFTRWYFTLVIAVIMKFAEVIAVIILIMVLMLCVIWASTQSIVLIWINHFVAEPSYCKGQIFVYSFQFTTILLNGIDIWQIKFDSMCRVFECSKLFLRDQKRNTFWSWVTLVWDVTKSVSERISSYLLDTCLTNKLHDFKFQIFIFPLQNLTYGKLLNVEHLQSSTDIISKHGHIFCPSWTKESG